MKGIKLLLNIIYINLLVSCNNPTEPPNPTPPFVEEPILTLELDDAHCTEAWIKLTSINLQMPNVINLKQFNPIGDSLIRIINIITPDTMLYIDSLLPKKTYRYKAEAIINNKVYSSNELIVQTMDTTSHNFTFEMITFGGEIGSSVLYDVAIINENNIWAVGDIWIKDDTSSLGYTNYNAVHWDGSKWHLKRIRYYGNCSVVEYPPLFAIWAFSENNIVITNGGSIGWFNGNTVNLDCRVNPLLTGYIKKMWGISNSELYVVGINGNIAFYNGTSWRKIESNTTLNINDIWGDYNEKTKEWEILAVASNKFFDEGSTVIKIEGSSAKDLNKIGLPWSLSSIWFKSSKRYFIGGDGLFTNKKINDVWIKDTTFIPIYKDRIRGININDIVVSGSNGLLSHFNGYSWRHYINNELPHYSGRLLSVDIKQDVIVAVGWIGNKAIITIGRR